MFPWALLPVNNSIIGSLPIVGIIAWVLGLAVDVYVLVGIIILVLAYLKIVK